MSRNNNVILRDALVECSGNFGHLVFLNVHGRNYNFASNEIATIITIPWCCVSLFFLSTIFSSSHSFCAILLSFSSTLNLESLSRSLFYSTLLN